MNGEIGARFRSLLASGFVVGGMSAPGVEDYG
jgi:hypothetical protein